ncbi:MAG TPA: ATP-binding protein [Verrucomicrobiota bacterium]|nr:ATP-binding protein [Verrucomicrobiota bacterium]HNU49998.1 ATP-binding protein [Verrucomicrobiota bacterium]
MVKRNFWLNRIEHAWKRRPVVWLRGVRRTGKTFLARSLPDVEFFDCELPRVRRAIEDPEPFLDAMRGHRVVLDEVHRLPNPSEVLKLAADHFPEVRIVATGSSTLGASARFRDTLAGRKAEVWLTPMIEADLADFGKPGLPHRLLHGGLPPFFLSADLPEADFQEWMDAYWAKDILELFRLERRASFQRFVELLLAQSGGMFEATRFAAPCEVSRSTIQNYLAVLEATAVVIVVRPFSSRRATEIVTAPKVYGFDTGFVCAQRGWTELRNEDLGRLWEHYVLNEILALTQSAAVQYWRDKQGHEVDFVWAPRGGPLSAIECKWSARVFDPQNLLAFGRLYPGARLWVVTTDAQPAFRREYRGWAVDFLPLAEAVHRLATTAVGTPPGEPIEAPAE